MERLLSAWRRGGGGHIEEEGPFDADSGSAAPPSKHSTAQILWCMQQPKIASGLTLPDAMGEVPYRRIGNADSLNAQPALVVRGQAC